MITSIGKTHILSYMAGLAPSIAQYISVGVATNLPSLSDSSLGLEVARFPVSSVSVDPVSNKIVFKGSLPEGSEVAISEVGLWSMDGGADSYLLATFDDAQDGWVGGSMVNSPESRLGATLYRLPVSGTTASSAKLNIEPTDLSAFTGPNDRWAIGMYKTGAANVSVDVSLKSDNSGTAVLKFYPSGTTATGYLTAFANFNSAVLSGGFDPSAITECSITVTPAAGNSTTGSVDLDLVVLSNAPEGRGGSVLVGRKTISTFRTDGISSTDVEYELGVTV